MKFDCESCKNKEDCEGYKSQAVRDVSTRCGLVCHSSVGYIMMRDKQ